MGRLSTPAQDEGDDKGDDGEERHLYDEVEKEGGEAGTESGQDVVERNPLSRRGNVPVLQGHLMKLERFLAERSGDWSELEALLGRGDVSGGKAGPDELRHLGRL